MKHSFEVVLYGDLAGAGFLLLLPLLGIMIALGIFAGGSGQGRYQVFGIATICISVALLVATPWAGLLWLGYGW